MFASRFLMVLLTVLVVLTSPALASDDYYDILGVSRDATTKQLKKAFRKKSMELHPDQNQGDEAAKEKFMKVNEAYEVLNDEEKRQVYDLDGHSGLERHRKGMNQPRDPFGGIFGGMGRGGRRKGPDYRMEVQVTLEDIYNGAERNFNIQRKVICSGCKGTGAEGGKEVHCKTCDGKGTRLTMQKLGPGFNVQMQTTCDKCGGRGKTAAKRCSTCKGAKVVNEVKELNAFIERGIPDKHELVFERASEQTPGVTPGDVILVIKTKSHRVFKRDGNNLLMTMTITLKEALLGFSKKVTHLDGHEVIVKREAVTQPNFVMKIQDEGMPHHESASDKGELHVKFKVKLPTKLTDAQKEAAALL